MKVIYTVDVVYGNYSGTTKVWCDENDDMEIIKGKVRRELSLNFLSMAYYHVKIINTEYQTESA